MDFKSFVFKELLEDEYFIQWLTAPDKESDRYWHAWMRNNPDKAAVLKDIKAVVNAIEPKRAYQLEEEEKDVLLGHIQQYAAKRQGKIVSRSGSKKRRKMTNVGLMAASFIILAILTANYFGLFHRFDDVPVLMEERLVLKQTNKGTKSSFYLPDGTLVKLNSASSLEFPAVFSDTLRKVKLTGQAFFEVTRNEEVPFIVETERMEIQVLGTSFDVLSNIKDELFEVAVASGKVKVNTYSGNQEILGKTEMTHLDMRSGQLIKEHFDPDYKLGWKDGILAFEGEDFGRVFRRLEDWFGVTISVSSDIALEKSYTGKYDNQSLENEIGRAHV